MLIAALILNVVILAPVIWSLSFRGAGMDVAFGADTPARRILACVYGSIALLSIGLIVLHSAAHPWAIPMTLALFAVQIIYKAATLWAVGVANPVVMTNMLVIVVQAIAIVTVWRAGSFSA
ncbi:hypothetical protein ACERZ8_07895 [Tateyamaria armeniaca]|uniref:Uncharacterized protein n=1 Tax=Tateyamaria armeniaca TaxID=2518930 RepID=A0ABW8URP3_9RHOB